MARSGFKMKGSPMQRNFGIGSPARKLEKKKKSKSSKESTFKGWGVMDVLSGGLTKLV